MIKLKKIVWSDAYFLFHPIEQAIILNNLEKIADWREEEKIKKILRTPIKRSIHDQIGWAKNITENKADDYYFIYEGKSEVLIGYCGLDKISNINKTAEISLMVDPNRQGKGIGKKAANLLLDIGFDQHKLNCIYGEVYSTTTTVEFWKKCGFSVDGIVRARKYWDNKYFDSYMISITKEE